jgi:hypothetical protein
MKPHCSPRVWKFVLHVGFNPLHSVVFHLPDELVKRQNGNYSHYFIDEDTNYQGGKCLILKLLKLWQGGTET